MKLSETFDKRYLARVGLTVVSAALALGVIIFAAYHILDRMSPGLDLVDALPKTVTHTISADAYIMRNEEPLYAEIATHGSIAPTVGNGERVAIHQKVADVYAQMSPEIEKRLSEIDEQIELLLKNREDGRSVQSAAGLDGEIYDAVFAVRDHCADGNYSDALGLKTNLLVSIRKKEILTGMVKNYDAQIAMLEEEKASLRAQLGVCLEQIYAPTAGYYVSEYDGYGQIFSSSIVDTVSYDEFMEKTTADPEKTTGMTVGAMLHDFRWYIACPMTKTDAAYFAEMARCSVTFSYSGDTLEMKPYRIITESRGSEAIVVFSCEKMPRNFDYTRKQPVEISAAEFTGYEIPTGAIRVVDGVEGVYILDEVTIRFRRIRTIYTMDGAVICVGDVSDDQTSDETEGEYSWIRQNDIVIVGGRDLEAGKVIG